MASIASPAPPSTGFSDDNPHQRINFRLWQITMSAITLLITIWFFTLNSLAGILALVVAKHIWVAILAAGLTRYPKQAPAADSAATPADQ
jgi:hypothetical protein